MTDPLEWLFALEQFGIKFGLDNIRALASELGSPEQTFTSLHVAGTNGKGSVTAMADSALRAAGHLSARYTSPHLVELAERYVIDGAPVARGALVSTVADTRLAVERLLGRRALGAHPTFFEVTTAVAFELFRRAAVDVAVCEVGLGGRLDATNILAPVATAITTIGLEHQQYLGSTLREIAIEKAGIIKPGTPVVVGDLPDEALEAVVGVAQARKAEVIIAHEGVVAMHDAPTRRLRLRTPAQDYGDIELALAGAHQVHNAIVTVRLLETADRLGVRVPAAAIASGLAAVRWPGRLDTRRLEDGREILLDAAHNPDGAAALARHLATLPGRPRPLVFAAMADKDTAAMLAALVPRVSAVVTTRSSSPRAADPALLAAQAQGLAPALPISVEPSPPAALAAAWTHAPAIVVAGSVFLLGDVMKDLGGSW
jgi:dihydrofolate synthase/folylpolyglutamate synthase